MKIKCFIFEEHIFLIKNIGSVLQYHYVHGEESTSVVGWGNEQWKYFVNYIAKSLGRETTKDYEFTLYVHPSMKQKIKVFTSLLTNYKHESLLVFLTSYFKTHKTHYVSFNSVPIGFSQKGYHSIQRDKLVEYNLLSCCSAISNSAIERQSSPQKNKTNSYSNKSIKFKIPVAKNNRKKLNNEHDEIVKEGTIFHITGSSFMLAVDDVSLFIAERFFEPYIHQSINEIVENGDSVKVYCHRNSVSIELMGKGINHE
ncbi:MAG: hypothetical protein HRU38_22590 [Saccharospirillaceae bacterium]|nr:hypothetical protein [Saccharospirillaceae bacterium]